MANTILLTLAGITVLGVLAQWIAWRVKLPTILFLLAAGLAVGPCFHVLEPDKIFGDLLLPIVSLGVAVILFEGGLSLKIRDLVGLGAALCSLLTVGLIVTAIGTAIAANIFLGLDWHLATVLGSILTVTGPTVVAPLLRHMHLGGRAGALLRWEGIAIDPIGAMFAALVFRSVPSVSPIQLSANLALTSIVGAGFGLLGAFGLIFVIRYYLAPDRLHGPIALSVVLGAYALADALQPEAGLVAVTIMGIFLANQRRVSIRHIIEFKENITVLLLSGLFIILGARVDPSGFATFGFGGVLFLLALIFIIRPASVLLSTAFGNLRWEERLFLAAMAPRGIVAAAVASVFALELQEHGFRGADQLVPATFLTIFGTCAFYSIASPRLARHLKLVQLNREGVLFVGAPTWAIELALSLKQLGFEVCVVDTDRSKIAAARIAGLTTHYGSILSDHAQDEIDTSPLRRLIAVTSNDELNTLSCQRFMEEFGREEVYHLPCKLNEGRHETVGADRQGRTFLGSRKNVDMLFESKVVVKTTKLSEQYSYESFLLDQGEKVIPAFLVLTNGKLVPIATDSKLKPKAGDMVVSLVMT